MADVTIGKVTHYYDKIGVAIILLKTKLAIGDKIKFVKKGEELFQQEVTSIQKEHQNLDSAGKGDEVGVKADQPVKVGVEVYKI